MCALALSQCQHLQPRIYALLSLEWSLHASSVQPLANWKSHLLTSLAFSRQINGSMNQWEGMNRVCLRGNGLSHTHTHAYTHKIFTIDMWVTLSITAVMAMQCCEWNDFMSEKICCWIQLWLVVRDLDSFGSLVEGWAINLRLTFHWSGKLRARPFIKLNRFGVALEMLYFLGDFANIALQIEELPFFKF